MRAIELPKALNSLQGVMREPLFPSKFDLVFGPKMLSLQNGELELPNCVVL